ncbi:hypothetical protein P4678_22295 [Priestia megaterium]|uniref:hypothetical protein n=1 Tax=Priestia megaterium TaxID=1404 RepID=UPI002E232139|nr:hypothetical protein [Priestia megaterium]
MSFEETVDRFLKRQKEGEYLSDASIIRYRHKLNIFNEYLTIKCKVTEDTFETYLRGILADHILNSLDFYIETRDIKCEDTARSYISAIKEYFRYINKEENLKNNLVESFSYDQDFEGSFSYVFENKIKQLRATKILEYPKQVSPIDENEFERLRIHCDKTIREAKINNIFKEGAVYRGPYNRLISALIVKLMLFSGIKFESVSSIKISDLNLKYNTIKINGYITHLPNNLSDQLRKYKEFRDRIKTNSEILFVKFNGDPIPNTSDIGKFVEDKMKNQSTMSIGKFVILNMIRKGINQSVIQQFTGYGISIFTSCQEIVNEEKPDKDRYLDSKLRDIYTFDIL